MPDQICNLRSVNAVSPRSRSNSAILMNAIIAVGGNLRESLVVMEHNSNVKCATKDTGNSYFDVANASWICVWNVAYTVSDCRRNQAHAQLQPTSFTKVASWRS